MSNAVVRLTREDGYRAEIRSGNHTYYADEPLDKGGTDTMATPSQMAMGALGACIAITLRMYADRKAWPLESIEVDLDFERFKGIDYPGYEGDEGIVHEVRKAIRLTGDLDDEQRERLIEIAGKCPVHRLMSTPTFFVEKALAEDSEAQPD